MTMTEEFRLTVNGEAVAIRANPDTPLLSVLRDELDLKGSRFGCGVGLCGACFVRLDNDVVPSCDTPIWSAGGRSVVTVEGLGTGEQPHPVQKALLEGQAAQCGFCISGIAVRAAALLEQTPRASAEDVREALDRNLCRCGVQRRIVKAIVRAGESPT